jgi:nucleotide-binding universal stress UspA family protein
MTLLVKFRGFGQFIQRMRETEMFKKIMVAYNHSAEASRAMAAAIDLAKALHARLAAVSTMDPPPVYTVYATAATTSLVHTLRDDQRERYLQLHSEARNQALQQGVELTTHILDGDEVDAIVDFALRLQADLLVIGIHQHSLYISRLWSSVYSIAQSTPCSVLGVH